MKDHVDWTTSLNKAIELGTAGKSLTEIGEYFGVTRQRMAQVFKFYGVNPVEIGVRIQPRLTREETARLYFKNLSLQND